MKYLLLALLGIGILFCPLACSMGDMQDPADRAYEESPREEDPQDENPLDNNSGEKEPQEEDPVDIDPKDKNPQDEDPKEGNLEEENPQDKDPKENDLPEDKNNEHEKEDEDEEEEVIIEPLFFKSIKAEVEKEIEIEFFVPVIVKSINFIPALEIDSIADGETVKIHLAERPLPGIKYSVTIQAEDENGNQINVTPSIFPRSSNAPVMLINELRTEYSKPRCEYIEFVMLTDGNLGGLKVFAASNNKNPLIYEFLPVEVKQGEYVVLHMRTLDDDCRDEYGNNLDESGGTDSSPLARDFWVPGNTKLLRKTDAVYVLDQDGYVLCGVMISETPDVSWTKDYFEQAAEFLCEQGAWLSPSGGICSPAEAISSAEIKTAATRSICRDETVDNTNTALDWYICANSCATPGMPNNPKRFTN